MRPLIVTIPTGEKRRLNPMQVIGWTASDVPAPTAENPGRVVIGSTIALPDGPRLVLESEMQHSDRLFERATEGTVVITSASGTGPLIEGSADPEPKTSHPGRSAGGRARAASMTPEERSSMARKGAAARWGNGGGITSKV